MIERVKQSSRYSRCRNRSNPPRLSQLLPLQRGRLVKANRSVTNSPSSCAWKWRKKAALDVSKQVRAFIDKFVAKGEIPVAEQSEMVQDFYTEFADRIMSN